ncbi:hypothetical protein A4G18_00270 [Pasteurellaceae bacterium Pebbles2]|nr:hypothetical protein [Pasteurellaceae bacterium Pebbles2]
MQHNSNQQSAISNQQSAKILISFIVPVYNDEQYLAECLDSILNVTDSKEIILINDGSTDNTLAIMQAYQAKFPEIIRIINQENQGVSVARNNGIDAARGEWIFFVDGDDQITFDTMAEVLSQEKQADLVKGFIASTDDYGTEVGTGSEKMSALLPQFHLCSGRYKKTLGNHISTMDYLQERIASGFFPAFTTYFYRRSFLNQHQLRFPIGLTHCEDMLFITRCYFAGADTTLLEINRIVYHYIVRPCSTMRQRTLEHMRSILQTTEHLAKMAKNQTDPLKHSLLFSLVSEQFLYLFHQYFAVSSEEEREKICSLFTPFHWLVIRSIREIRRRENKETKWLDWACERQDIAN